MEIYKYNHKTKEWYDFVNSCEKLKGEERKKAFDIYIQNKGEKVSLQDYFNDFCRDRWPNDYSYRFIGEPQNCIERLANAETENDDDLGYLNMRELQPEELCEDRTDWNEMVSYANGLARFIDTLKEEIAAGKLETYFKNQ